jgi:PAS domain S-box-containing protein
MRSMENQNIKIKKNALPLFSRISTKLLVLFVPLILLAIFAMYNNQRVLQRIDSAREHIGTEVHNLVLAARLEELTVEISRAMYQSAAYVVDGNRAGLMESMEAMNMQKPERLRILQELNEGIHLENARFHGHSEESNIEELESLLKEENAKDSEIMEEMMSADEAVALNSLQRIETELRPLTERLDAAIDAFVNERQEEVEESQKAIAEAQRSGGVSLTAIAVLGVVLLVLAFFLLMKWLMQPLMQLRKTAQAIAEGNLNARSKVASNDEIGLLAKSFNAMSNSLMKSGEYTKNLISTMPSMLIVITPEAIIQSVNPSTLEMLGYRQKELVGQPVDIILGAAAAAAAAAADSVLQEIGLARLVEEGKARDIRMTLRAKNGDPIPVALSGSVLKNKQGEEEAIVLVAKDLRDIKKYASERLQTIMPVLQKVALGDFRQKIELPQKEDEFTEHLVALNIMIDDFKEMIEARAAAEKDTIAAQVAAASQAESAKRKMAEKMTMELENKVDERTKELEEAKKGLEAKVADATQELQQMNKNLEVQVAERTDELKRKLLELERFNKVTMGREMRILELKEELGKYKPTQHNELEHKEPSDTPEEADEKSHPEEKAELEQVKEEIKTVKKHIKKTKKSLKHKESAKKDVSKSKAETIE